MKWLCYLLLASILGVLLWYTQIEIPARKPAAQPTPDKTMPQLQLLSEYQQIQKIIQLPEATQQTEAATVNPEITASAEMPVDIPQQLPASAPKPSCYTLGPFKDPTSITEIRKQLHTLHFKTGQRSKVGQELFGYRVYLPSYGSQQQAKKATQELDKNGIRDYFIVQNEQGNRYAISLGLFRNKKGAQRRIEQIRRFDFKPLMEVRYREQLIHWLDIESEKEILTEDTWQKISEGLPELQKLPRNCGSENPAQNP